MTRDDSADRATGVAPCDLLPWDTQFFGFRVVRVTGHRLDPASAQEVTAWCERERIACLYFLADADDRGTVATAETFGFSLKDVRVSYRGQVELAVKDMRSELPAGVRIRPARPADAPALEEIAQDSYTMSRFYFDERFPRKQVSLLYRTWIRQSVQGQADRVLVLEDRGQAKGFITCHLLGPREGHCPLVALARDCRGLGLGPELYRAALSWFARENVESVVYVTQGRNIRAQRVIQRLGFLIETIRIWYHRWFDVPGG